MADGYLPFQNPTATDAKLDTESLSVGANTVHRERIQIAGTAATDIAPVSATDGLLVNLGANNDVVVTDLKDGAGDSVMDSANDAVFVTVKAIQTTDALNSRLMDGSGSHKATIRNYTNAKPLTTILVDTNGDDITALPITDNGGSLTVDGTVAVSGTVTVDSELTTADLDTGAGTDTRAVVGIVGSKSGGAQLIPGDATAGLKVDLGADNDVTVTSGTITTITNVVQVDDNSGSLTVDAPVGTPVFVRLSDGAAAISTLPVSLASVPSHAVTNAGTFVVQENGAALTSLQLIDDTVYTDDTSTHSTGASKGILFMAAATPTDAAVNANDIGAVAMTVNRELLVQVNTALPAGTNAIGKLAANSGVDIGDVDVTSIIPGTGATNLGKSEDAAHTTGDTGVMALAVSNEANTARAADGDYLPIATDTEGNVRVVGNRDHDAVDAGEVVGVGGRAIAHGSNPTAVAAADRTAWYFNRAGVPFMIGGHPNIVNKHIQVTDADGAQTDAALVTVGAGTKIIVTRYSVTVDSATTATGGVAVRMGFGTANTPSNDANSGMLMAHSGIPAGGGIAEGDGSGIIGMGADNEDLRLTCEDPVGGNIDIVVSYYTIES